MQRKLSDFTSEKEPLYPPLEEEVSNDNSASLPTQPELESTESLVKCRKTACRSKPHHQKQNMEPGKCHSSLSKLSCKILDSSTEKDSEDEEALTHKRGHHRNITRIRSILSQRLIRGLSVTVNTDADSTKTKTSYVNDYRL